MMITEEVLLGNPDASSLADLDSSFSVIRKMRLVPINKLTLVALAAAALPMIPVVVFATPTYELIRVVMKMLR
jgi:hypothetical protein